MAAAAGVEVTGTLDDIRPAIAQAALCVVPLRAGSGTRLKIFEALAMGKAVVSTTLGAEGLAMESGPALRRRRRLASLRRCRRRATARWSAPASVSPRPAARWSSIAIRGRRSPFRLSGIARPP